jgi:hypothetical protein
MVIMRFLTIVLLMIVLDYSAFPLQRHQLLLVLLNALLLLHLLYAVADLVLLCGDLRLISLVPLVPLVVRVVKGFLLVRFVVHQALHGGVREQILRGHHQLVVLVGVQGTRVPISRRILGR